MGEGILSGIRVIDAATYIAAPGAATVLSDFGAEVIKIERPPNGDPYRYLPQVSGMPLDTDHNYCWLLDGRNKKSVALNLADDAGREILLRLAVTADVFITNFQPQLIVKFRLGYEQMRAANERLIYASVTGYGEVGPDREKPGYDMTGYWARSGLMDQMHDADAEPALSPAGFGDHPTAMSLFGAILLGLYHRERTGQGLKVSTTLMANGAWSNSCLMQAALFGARWPERGTRRRPNNPLVNHYLTRDRRRFIFCLLDPVNDWPRLCRAMGREELLAEPRFQTPAARREHSGELVEILDGEFAGRDMAEWAARFAGQDVLFGPVPSIEEAARDPQMEAAGVISGIENSPLKTISNPIVVDGVAKTRPQLAPEVGEHSREVLAELGFRDEEIEDLIERRIVKAS